MSPKRRQCRLVLEKYFCCQLRSLYTEYPHANTAFRIESFRKMSLGSAETTTGHKVTSKIRRSFCPQIVLHSGRESYNDCGKPCAASTTNSTSLKMKFLMNTRALKKADYDRKRWRTPEGSLLGASSTKLVRKAFTSVLLGNLIGGDGFGGVISLRDPLKLNDRAFIQHSTASLRETDSLLNSLNFS